MLRIHFLNVGHGDCTIIEHPSGRITMVDINNGDDLDDTSYDEILNELGAGSTDRPVGPSRLADVLRVGSTNPFASVLSALELSRRGGTFERSPSNASGLRQRALAVLREHTKRRLQEAGYTVGLTNPVDFFIRKFPRHSVFRYIQSHPDLDHMRGLVAIRNAGIHILNFWDTQHDKVPEFRGEEDEAEWNAYEMLRQGSSGARVLRLYRGDTGAFWNQDPTGYGDHDSIEILSPTPAIVQEANKLGKSNNLSYVLRISYMGYRIVLGGDAETEVWQDLVAHYDADLRCDVLKASHHGRDSGYYADAVRLMSPDYTIVSVGKKPATDASNKYRRYCSNVWSTRWYGNLTLEISRERGMRWFAEHVD